jgi:hypothetical protein
MVLGTLLRAGATCQCLRSDVPELMLLDRDPYGNYGRARSLLVLTRRHNCKGISASISSLRRVLVSRCVDFFQFIATRLF